MKWIVETSRGGIPVIADDGVGGTVVVLAHGAGSHMEHKTLEWLSGLVRETGARVARFNFLYRAQGKSMPDRMPVLVETYQSVVKAVRAELKPDKLIVGGHSMGGRVATMMESEGKTVDGLLLFGYPLHPPGQHDKLRDAHLPLIVTSTLQLNGTEDDFCDKTLMEEVLARLDPTIWKLMWIEGADHSYSVKKSSGRTRKDVENDIRAALPVLL